MSTNKGREVPETVIPFLESIRIRGFRGFSDLQIGTFERVNIISGKNNVGKTAVLETIFIQLGPNNPELMLRTNLFRGIERADLDPEEIWGGFFYDRLLDRKIEINTKLTDYSQTILRIGLESSNRSSRAKKSGQRAYFLSTTQNKRDELVFEYHRGSGNPMISRASIDADGELQYNRANLRNQKLGIFLGTRTRILQEDAARYSKIERIGNEDKIYRVMRIIEPRLRKLSVLYIGGVPMIHADIGASELIPVPVMGEGMSRILSIVLGIISIPGGIVLIDEIENGIHYSVHEDIWRAIAETAEEYDVQIFATTHSWECIRAAHKAFSSRDAYDLRVFRLERDEVAVRSIQYDRSDISTAVDMDIEIR